MDELTTFKEFAGRHITEDPEWDVQRMLLWTEWVRYYLKRTRRFPECVLEHKFDELIASQYKVSLGFDTFRGTVYVGIKFLK